MGTRDCDWLEVSNAWAHVQITRMSENGERVHFTLTGDGTDAGRRALRYMSSDDALRAALDCLKDYQQGRAD